MGRNPLQLLYLLIFCMIIQIYTLSTPINPINTRSSTFKVSVKYPQTLHPNTLFSVASDLSLMHSWVQVVSVTVDTSATNPRLPSNISIWRVSSPLRKVPRRLLNIVPEGIRDTEEFTWMAESERDEGGRELRWRSVDMGGGVLEGNINLPNKGCIM